MKKLDGFTQEFDRAVGIQKRVSLQRAVLLGHNGFRLDDVINYTTDQYNAMMKEHEHYKELSDKGITIQIQDDFWPSLERPEDDTTIFAEK